MSVYDWYFEQRKCSNIFLNKLKKTTKKIKTDRRKWMFHNAVGHPLMMIFNVLGSPSFAAKVHDATVPMKFKCGKNDE